MITLSHKHSVFSVGFVSLDYVAPDKNRYAYKPRPDPCPTPTPRRSSAPRTGRRRARRRPGRRPGGPGAAAPGAASAERQRLTGPRGRRRPHIRELLSAMLEAVELTVVAVASAEEALARVRGSPFHLVVLDWNLPKMTGTTCAGRCGRSPGSAIFRCSS